VRALEPDQLETLLVGGDFTDAGGDPNADHIAAWDGSRWGALGTTPLNGIVSAIAVSGGRVFAGGNFTDAGGNPNADGLAAWDGTSWSAPCGAGGFGSGVLSLQVIGSNLYIGGGYQNAGGNSAADGLTRCDLNTGTLSPVTGFDTGVGGTVYALTADAAGNLYAGGTFINMQGIPAADYVAEFDGTNWHAMGSGGPPDGGAVEGIVRGLGSRGNDVFVGSDAVDIAGIPQADHVARWDGAAWSAMGSNAAGTDGWFPPVTSINAIAALGSDVYAGGNFQNADGDPTADTIGRFDGTQWHGLGVPGATDGPLGGPVLALTTFGGTLHVGGNFTSAGGDSLAEFVATFGAKTLPPPVEGKSVNAVPEKGKVFVKLPGAGRPQAARAWGFVPLEQLGSAIPVGSTLDTRKGTVRLIAAASSSGKTQTGHVSQGMFRVLQSRKNPLTTLKMTGGGLNACSRLPSGGAPKGIASTVRRRGRSLFTSVKGRFRTRGRNSTATVRGTRYLVKDTCKGTLTKVLVGSVTVRDLTLRQTKTVKAGHSYLARPPGPKQRRGNR
jgi:hypothetical protein